jgi:gliding motility-associated-like protein
LAAIIKHIIFIASFLAPGISLLAQPYAAKFEVNSEIGCNQFTVVVTDLSGAPDTVAVNYDYGDGSAIDTATSHTYSQAGIYQIIQTVANANPRQDTVTIEVINQYAPEFMLLSCKGSSASVIVRDALYEAYEISWGDGFSEVIQAYTPVFHSYAVFNNYDVTVKGLINGAQSSTDFSNLNCFSTTKRLNMIIDIQPATINEIRVLDSDVINGRISVNYSLVPNNNYLIEIRNQNQPGFIVIDTINRITNPTNYILSNLNTEDNYYCISITAFDPCDGETRQSNIGCSVMLETTALNQQNQLNWQTSSNDFFNYRINKDGSQLAQINSQAQNQYLDNQVNCGMRYSYQVVMREGNGFISISDTSQITAISTDVPDPIMNISASVDDRSILLSWEAPINYLPVGYIVSKSTNGTVYEVMDTVQGTGFTDPDLFTQSARYYYRISYYDACGNLSSQGITASAILLTAYDASTITWSDYEGWESGVREYMVDKYDETGQLIESISMGLSTIFQEDLSSNPYQNIVYRIRALPNDFSVEAVESNILKVIYPSNVAFPNAFSPNGDGINDIFTFKSRFIISSTMKIYNRWGELIFQTTDPDRGWDGTINGKAAPPGTYIHQTELTDEMGITFIKSGEVVLIR